MELDDLKRSWEQYDRKLTENLQLNQELLRRSNLDRSRREMGTVMALYGGNVPISTVLILLCLRWTIQFGHEPIYLICGSITMLFFLWSLIGDARGFGKLRSIDYYNSSLMELQKQIHAFSKYAQKGRKFGLAAMPIVMITLFIMFFKGVKGVDILDHPKSFAIIVVLSLVLGYLLTFWIWRNLLDKKVKAARRHLDELEAFEREEE